MTDTSELANHSGPVGQTSLSLTHALQAADGITIALGIVLLLLSLLTWTLLFKAAFYTDRTHRADHSLLGGVAMVAPFLGLLGTVWGIMHTLIMLGSQTTLNFQMIAAPLGEALLMTALGLFVAIPAAAGQRWVGYLLGNRNTGGL